MKCTEYDELSTIEKLVAKWYYKETGPHHYLIYDYDIEVWTKNGNFANSNIYLKCKDCGQRKRIHNSRYPKYILKKMATDKEVFTDEGATFER